MLVPKHGEFRDTARPLPASSYKPVHLRLAELPGFAGKDSPAVDDSLVNRVRWHMDEKLAPIDEKLAAHQAQAVQMDAKITSLGAKMDTKMTSLSAKMETEIASLGVKMENILSLLQGQHSPVALPARHRTVSETASETANETANETRVKTGKVTNTSAAEPTPEPAANARLRSPPLLVRPRERRRALAPPRQLVR